MQKKVDIGDYLGADNNKKIVKLINKKISDFAQAQNVFPVLTYLPSIDSTNNFFSQTKQNSKSHSLFKEIDICYTTNQTKGKGSFGKTWVSNPNFASLTLTMRFYQKHNSKIMQNLSINLAKILYKVLVVIYTKLNPDKVLAIKLPNDIVTFDKLGNVYTKQSKYAKNNLKHIDTAEAQECLKKLGGILIERKLLKNNQHQILFGVGINIIQSQPLSINSKNNLQRNTHSIMSGALKPDFFIPSQIKTSTSEIKIPQFNILIADLVHNLMAEMYSQVHSIGNSPINVQTVSEPTIFKIRT